MKKVSKLKYIKQKHLHQFSQTLLTVSHNFLLKLLKIYSCMPSESFLMNTSDLAVLVPRNYSF